MSRTQKEETEHIIAESQKGAANRFNDINKSSHGLTSAAQAGHAQSMQQLKSEQDAVTAKVARQTAASKERERKRLSASSEESMGKK